MSPSKRRPHRRQNKQRIPFLSRREIAAAKSGGVLDERIPTSEVEHIIRKCRKYRFEEPRLLSTLGHAVGWYRLRKHIPQLSPAEIIDQARQTVAVAEELRARLTNMHPTLAAFFSEASYRAHGAVGMYWEQTLTDTLFRVSGYMNYAAGRVQEFPATRGRKQKWARSNAFHEVHAELVAVSTPKMTAYAARDLAAELLQACGVDMPTDVRQLRRLLD